jgi:putative NADH-flavin reductase
MNIVVFGANGRVGSKLVERLLSDGHRVTAFVHGNHNFAENSNLKIVTGDIYNPSDIKSAINGCDAVMSALGSWGTKSKNVLSSAMQNIIPLMTENNCKRIVSLTGAGAFDEVDSPTALDRLNHFMLSMTAPKILKDGEKHISMLRKSQLDWTVIRSPIMKSGDEQGYELVNRFPKPWETIRREDVVSAMIACLYKSTHLKSAPFIRTKS